MAEENNTNEIRDMVRVKQTDLDGNKHTWVALTKIKGVGESLSMAVCKVAGIDSTTKLGRLTDDQIQKIEEIFDNPLNNNIPSWLLNRRNDYDEGVDKHLLTGDLDYTKSGDLRRLQKIKSYRGLRLQWGLTVRGQRTKAHFRKRSKKTIGVKRKK